MAKISLIKYRMQSQSTQPKTTKLFEYELGNFKRLSYDINSPVSPAPLPEEDSDENILLKIEGNSSQLTLAWKIKDETNYGDDRDNRLITNNSESGDGDYYFTGNTKTVQEQVHFIRKFLRAASIDDAYTLRLEYDSSDESKNLEFNGTFTQFHFDTAEVETLTLNATCKFLEGNVQALYEIDAPSPPRNLVITSAQASPAQITYNWDTPLESGTSSITGYYLFYQPTAAGGNPLSFLLNSTSTSKTILNGTDGVTLSSNTSYKVWIVAISKVGNGQPSVIKNIVTAGS